MARPSRRALLALAVLGALLVGLGALWRQRLPLAESLVRRIVAAAGVAGAELRVAEVGPRGALLEAVRVGDPPDLEIERIALRYSLLGLARGRVAEAAIGGLRLRARSGEAGVSFGALDAALRSGGADAAAPSGGASLPPLDGLVVHDARVELSTPEGVASLRIDGEAGVEWGELAGGFTILAERGASRAAAVVEVAGGVGARRLAVRGGTAAVAVPGLGPVAVEGIEGDLEFPAGGAPVGEILAARIRTPRTGQLGAALVVGSDELALEPGRIPIAIVVKAADGRARIEGVGALFTSPPAVELAIEGALPFAADGLQPADLAPEAAQWLERAVGVVGFQAALKAGRSPYSFSAHVEAPSIDLTTATGVPIEGLTFVADVTGLSPLRTKEQTLRFRLANLIGPFEDGMVRWRLRGTELEVLEAAWAYAGGRLTTAGRFDLTAAEQPFTVDVRGVSLEALLAQLEIADLSGSGSLSGTLPLVFDGTRLRVNGGVLTAAPPGGIVRYAPASAAPGSLGLGGDVDVLAGALEDFHYEKLRMEMSGALDGDVELGLEIDGRNPRYENGRPVELNVKVETNLPALLRASRSISGVPERIEERLRGTVPAHE